jgi:glycerophosphoryl diester phosphodiesterase
VNYPSAAADLLKKGIDMIITDDIEMVQKVREENDII